MLISLCIPCRNRTYDLKRTMPYLLEAAKNSPPIEIVVIDYNSKDDLFQYMQSVFRMPKGDETSIIYRKYIGRDYYHMAHARNLSVLASSGEYFVIISADIWLESEFLNLTRKIIEEYNYDWLEGSYYKGVIVCKRQAFIDAGGYDERFEFYGPEDRDLSERFSRRKMTKGKLESKYVHIISTSDEIKIKGYRLEISKREMGKLMHPIFEENNTKGILVANNGISWGNWS